MPENAAAIDYSLPSTVRSIQEGWLVACQSSAVTSGLLTVTSALLLFLFQARIESESAHSDSLIVALDILGYTSLLLNISACISSFILIDRLGDVPYRAAQRTNVPFGGKIALPQAGILLIYGIGSLWRWVVWHWIICFLLGFWTIFAQVLVYVWTFRPFQNRIAITVIAGFCLLPCLAFLLAPLVNRLSAVSHFTTDEESSIYAPPLPRIMESPIARLRHLPSLTLPRLDTAQTIRGTASNDTFQGSATPPSASPATRHIRRLKFGPQQMQPSTPTSPTHQKQGNSHLRV